MRCLYLHCSSALLRGLLLWPLRGCLKKVKQLLHCFLPRKEINTKLQSNNFPFQEGQGELFPWPPSQRGQRNHQPSLVTHLQTLEGSAAPSSCLLLGDLGMWVSVGALIPLLYRRYLFPQIFSVLIQTHIRLSRPDYLRFLKIPGRSVWSSLLCWCRCLCLEVRRHKELHINLKGACVKDISACWLKICIW